MEFESDVQKQVYEKVSGYMRDIFGEQARARPDRPVHLIQVGSTLTHVVVAPWGDDESVVMVRAYVVYQADLVPELLLFLLKENDSKRFGAFGVDRDGDIFFEHSIVGSTCDKAELKASVMAVVWTADQYDEQITQRWGGMREVDRFEQMKAKQ
ncbi:MAG TPA: YbjN domain-containing protein [Anaerolineae bacterium]|nr:YbjN domain-containing protein [Anaerolineae bacterium]